ncbi:MAG: hypothetical protein WBA45_10820 [Microthrixaceae bacterium]
MSAPKAGSASSATGRSTTDGSSSTSSPRSTVGGTGAQGEADWTEQVTNLVVDTVDTVRKRTTGPILHYSRASVNAVVAVLLALPVALLMVIGAVRLLAWALGQVWIAYTIVGTILVLMGVVLWSRRSKLPI